MPTCLQCGYLAIAGKEIEPIHRTYLTGDASGPRLEHADLVQCWRKQWAEYDKSDLSGDLALPYIFDEVEKDRRRCPFFFPYEPGLSPKAHEERQEARKRDALQWRIAGFGAVAGAITGGLTALAVDFVKPLLGWGQ